MSNLKAPMQTKSPASVPAPQEEQVLYTVYRSTIKNHGIIMKSGKVLHIIDNEFITANEEEIEFLDKEIKSGFPFIRKVDKITSSSRDPMKALRDKIIAEYEAKKAADAAKQVPVMGNSDTGMSVANKLNPGSTAMVEKLAAGSGI